MIYVVSGMNRSGTSMVAGMLKEGGLPLLYNPDFPCFAPYDNFEHNTFGNIEEYEWAAHPEKMQGRLIKLASKPLRTVPERAWKDLRVLWIERGARAFIRSIVKAYESRPEHFLSGAVWGRAPTPREVRRKVRRRRKELEARGIKLLRMRYEKIMKRSRREAKRMAKFFERPDLDIDAMAAVPDPVKWNEQ